MLFHNDIIVIKTCKGLGDAVYAYPVVYHYRQKLNGKIVVITEHKEVFDAIDGLHFARNSSKFDIDCRYLDRKHIKDTNQFQDILINSGAPLETKFEMDVVKGNSSIKTKKDIVLLRNPYLGMELIKSPILKPDFSCIYKHMKRIRQNHYVILLAHGQEDQDLFCSDVDLVLKDTSVNDLLNLVEQSKLVISQNGHMLAIAEALNKPTITLFSSLLKKCDDDFFKSITPEKVVTKTTSSYAYDDDHEKITRLILEKT